MCLSELISSQQSFSMSKIKLNQQCFWFILTLTNFYKNPTFKGSVNPTTGIQIVQLVLFSKYFTVYQIKHHCNLSHFTIDSL